MGSGASTQSLLESHREAREALTAQAERRKPLDASDIADLEQAKEEIVKLRRLTEQLYKVVKDLGAGAGAAEGGDATNTKEPTNAGAGRPKAARAAVFAGAAQNLDDFTAQTYEKSDEIRKLILSSIRDSILFKNCDDIEKELLIDSFKPVSVENGETVIKQGDQGDDFYVVESGKLHVFVVFPGATEPVEVRAPYSTGESFGELSLMYNNPRAATVRADEGGGGKLWSIGRMTVRGIITQKKKRALSQRLELLGKVVIGNAKLSEALSEAELRQLADALEEEQFKPGDCIVRQGETGDAFYILEKGEVDVYKREDDDEASGLGKKVGGLKEGDYFGERALLSDEQRAASCLSAEGGEGTRCLTLGREDFDRMLGSLSELMARTAGINATHKQATSTSREVAAPVTDGSGNHVHYIQVKPEDLEVLRTLGCGAFGSVKLVYHSQSDKHFALKCQAKKSILKNELQQHVLDERKLLMDFDHPFILRLHDSFQDDRYIYLVLELLLGGELFTHLRYAGQFSEKTSIFYAAAVLRVLSYMHERSIAYRDLKPENLVLDSSGYLKVVDFGLAKFIPSGMTWTICGTPDYLAPEIILNEGHDWAVDYWALGVLVFEMVGGVPPFYAEDPMATYEKILGSKVQMPEFMSKNLRDLLRKLLKVNKNKRLGKTRGGSSAVMKHKWFSGFNWDGLIARELEAPIVPQLKGADDASNFGEPPDDEEPAEACPEWMPDF